MTWNRLILSEFIGGLLALIAIAGTIGLAWQHISIPDVLIVMDGAITSSFFTIRAANAASNGNGEPKPVPPTP